MHDTWWFDDEGFDRYDAREIEDEIRYDEERDRAYLSALPELRSNVLQSERKRLEAEGLSFEEVEAELEAMEERGEIDFQAEDLFEENIGVYMEECGCSDPHCPCSGTKSGRW